MAFIWDPFSTYWVNYDLGLSLHCPFLQALLFRILLTSVHIGTCSQFQQLPFSNETLVTASGWEVYFLRNSLPVQSFISFSSATFSVKQTLRTAPAGWKCPPLTCTALAQCSGQVWNYALANKWHPTHCQYKTQVHGWLANTMWWPVWFLDRSWNSLPELSTAMHDGKKNMAARRSTLAILRHLLR